MSLVIGIYFQVANTKLTFHNNLTPIKRISIISGFTLTNWGVFDNCTISIRATRSYTRVIALRVLTRFVHGAISINETFRSTIWRTS